MDISELDSLTPSRRLALASALESFMVFWVVGILIVLVGGIFVNLRAKLPPWYEGLLEEPISLKLFFTLSVLTLLLSILFTKKRHARWFNWIVLAPSRAGISCGSIAAGAMFGIGMGLYIRVLGDTSSELGRVALRFMGLGVFTLAILIPVVTLTMFFIDNEAKKKCYVEVVGVTYFAFTLSLAWHYADHFDLIRMAIVFVMAFFCTLLWKYAVLSRKRSAVAA